MAETKKEPKKETKKVVKKTTTKKPAVKKKTIKEEKPVKKETKKVAISASTEELVEINPILKEQTPDVMVIEKDVKLPFINTSHEFKTFEVVVVVLLAMIIGACVGGLVVNLNIKETKVIKTISATEDAVFNKILTTYNNMIENYVDDVDKEEIADAAIESMLGTLDDPYTSYFDEEETTTFYKKLKGTFYGIGCEIVSDGTNVYVTRILSDSPASKSGLEVGDIFKSINGETTIGITATSAVSIIEKAEGKITIVVSRDGATKTFELEKAKVTIQSVHTTTYEKDGKLIGYIKIDIFAQNTYSQFKKKLEALEKKNIDSLVIDVRDNSGGYLTVVANITSMFFDKSTVIYQMKTKDAITKKYSLTDEKRTYDVAVLINSNSASGSEILAAAIKEKYNGEVIGVNSFGKSSVQQTTDLGDGTMIKYTVQKWLTANGNDVGGIGLEPTITINQSDAYASEPTDENDAQLQKALSILSK